MKRVGLALGGGGARGVAHIAYLKALEEMGITPSIISGTSSGSMVGALYAGGMKPDAMYALLENLFSKKKSSGNSMSKIDKLPKSLVSSFVRKYLYRVLPKHCFEELDIPLKVVATNFNTLKERIFTDGDILNAVMGSIAFPSFFLPQPADGQFYMDGGATNIVPFDIIRDDCDILIAIDVSLVRPNKLKPSIKNSQHATWAATQEALILLKLANCAVEVFERPSFDNVATMEFHKYKYVYDRAMEQIPIFKQKLEKILKGECIQ